MPISGKIIAMRKDFDSKIQEWVDDPARLEADLEDVKAAYRSLENLSERLIDSTPARRLRQELMEESQPTIFWAAIYASAALPAVLATAVAVEKRNYEVSRELDRIKVDFKENPHQALLSFMSVSGQLNKASRAGKLLTLMTTQSPSLERYTPAGAAQPLYESSQEQRAAMIQEAKRYLTYLSKANQLSQLVSSIGEKMLRLNEILPGGELFAALGDASLLEAKQLMNEIEASFEKGQSLFPGEKSLWEEFSVSAGGVFEETFKKFIHFQNRYNSERTASFYLNRDSEADKQYQYYLDQLPDTLDSSLGNDTKQAALEVMALIDLGSPPDSRSADLAEASKQDRENFESSGFFASIHEFKGHESPKNELSEKESESADDRGIFKAVSDLLDTYEANHSGAIPRVRQKAVFRIRDTLSDLLRSEKETSKETLLINEVRAVREEAYQEQRAHVGYRLMGADSRPSTFVSMLDKFLKDQGPIQEDQSPTQGS